jgi:hypothetical protein
MRTNKKIRINPRTRVPVQVPETATEHISLRVTPAMKEYFRNQSDRHDLSMTKYIFNIFDFHFAHHMSNEFVSENTGYTHADHRVAVKSKSYASHWHGLQKVWNFIKSV